MQTPSRRVEPQTPMIAISRRIDFTLERLTRVEEDVVNIERPQRRIFGSVISQFTTINNSMQEMRDLINQDIRAKKKYFREETKILKKDSTNLQGLKMSFGRFVTAGALGLYGLSQIGQGKLGEGAAGVGGAAALLSPEILGVISTYVTAKIASSGLLNRGAGVGTMGTRAAGASKLRNPLLITAALAASLILPGLLNSNQNADRRRQMSATRVIRGAETINKPDVDRFRVILARFDSILSSISLERKKEGSGAIDERAFDDEPEKNKAREKAPKQTIEQMGLAPKDITKKSDEKKEEGGGFFDGIKNLFNFGKKEEVSQTNPVIDNSIAFTDQSVQEGDVNEGDVNVEGEKITNMIDNTSNLISMDMIETGSDGGASGLLPNMDIEMMSNEIVSNTGRDGLSIIDVSAPNKTNNSMFSGLAARPTFVSVGTKFDKSVPKFEAAASLRTWGAFT